MAIELFPVKFINQFAFFAYAESKNQTDLLEQESPRDKASMALAAMDR
jgi:hypothetical protein